jgi:hypothetical protein
VTATRRAARSLLCLAAVVGAGTVHLGCATGRLPAHMIALRVESNVKEASVLIDDRLVGRVSDLANSAKRLPAGFHRLEIRHPGYYSYFQEIEMKGGEEILVKAHLRELIQ